MTYGELNVDSVVNSDGETTGGLYGFKNRIINGAMMIDQRNAGASHTLATGGLRYGVDRFFTYTVGANVTGQQVAGTNIGTSKAYRITGATGTTLVNFAQRIEAVNIQDTAIQTVTASVKIYCSASITGAVVYIINPTASDNYSGNTTAFSTAITLNSGLNTITVSGVNGANGVYGAEIGIGFTSGIGNGVTVDIGAFQLEKGSTATSFDYRPYGTELQLCCRYFQAWTAYGSINYWGSTGRFNFNLPVQMRAAPTLALTGTGDAAGLTTLTGGSFSAAGTTFGRYDNTTSALANWQSAAAFIPVSASAEL